MNNRILDPIEERLELGQKKYGHENVEKDGRNFTIEALEEILEPIAREASAIKQRQENTSPNNDEVLASTPEKFDTEVAWYKVETIEGLVRKYKDLYGKDNKITYELLSDYFDHWLLSPYYHKADMSGPFNLRETRIANYTLQSRQISERSIKQLMNEYFVNQRKKGWRKRREIKEIENKNERMS